MNFHLFYFSLGLLFIIQQGYGQNCQQDGCPGTLCCSQFGYCGDTPEHCGTTTTMTTSNNVITLRPGDCRICGCLPANDCCSHYGYCGNTPDHCANLTDVLPETNLISQTRVGDCRICQNCATTQVCCPNTGYCVNDGNQCNRTSQPDPSKFYKIFNSQTNKFLDCNYFSTNPNSSTIIQWSESNTLNQIWQFLPVNQAANVYLIVSIETSKALTATSNSAFLQQWSTETDNPKQQFQIVQQNGAYQIINVQTQQSIIVNGNSNGASVQISTQQTSSWTLVPTDSADNRVWHVFVDAQLGEICNDDQRQDSANPLSLTSCLRWCNIQQRTRFCLWNLFDESQQIGNCTAAVQCTNRTLISNTKYRTYIYQPKLDEFSSNVDMNGTLDVPTAPLTNYIAYSKYLLIEANDFVLPSQPLLCTDFDPQKQSVLTFNDTQDGIRMCDLCPNLPPFDKYPDYVISSTPMTKTDNSGFDDCFFACVSDVRCIGYSYHQQNLTCLTFNQTLIVGTNGIVYEPQWTTVLIKQPVGMIQYWLYTRHTKIAMQIYPTNITTNQTDTFLQCLNICSHSPSTCLAVTYEFETKLCQLFADITTDNWIQLSYGSISAVHLKHIYQNQSNQWKFVLETDTTSTTNDISNSSPSNASQICVLPAGNSSSEYGSYYNPSCFIGGGNGCDLQTGCQLCLKFKANFEQNLPLCPSTLTDSSDSETARIQLDNCMNNCSNQSTSCLGFDYDPSTFSCIYIRTYSNWTINQRNNTKRYLLSYPPKTYQFIPDCQLTVSSTSNANSLDACLNLCQPPCTKVSYNYNTFQCQIGNYSTGISRVDSNINSHCWIRNFLPNNDLTSIRLAFDRSIGYQINVQSFQNLSFVCASDCSTELDKCLNTCLNSSQCQYVSVTYQTSSSFSCSFFRNGINETTDFLTNGLSEVYYRYFNIDLSQATIDNMTLFQVDSDLGQCYDQTRSGNKYDQTYSTLQGSKDTLDDDSMSQDQNQTLRRRRRNIFSKAFNWVKDNIVKPVVDTVVDIVKTPIQIGKAIGHAISGDTEQAKKEVLDIGIVKDAISLGENAVAFGKALGKGDLAEAGKSLLNVGADALGFIPIPGARVVGKIGSKGLKDALDNGKKDAKPQSKDRTDDDNKKSDDENEKQCSQARRRRAQGTKRPNCNNQQSNPKCPNPGLRNLLEEKNCNSEKINTKCEWLCDAGYTESDSNGAVCKKDNKRAIWQPDPECKVQACPTGNQPYIAVESDQFVVYVTYFDTKRKLPIWSLALHDLKNRATSAARVKGFTNHPCPQLSGKQYVTTQYTGSGYDRGHLSPSAAHRYSFKASKSSNFMINIAPQISWINSGPWNILEAHILCHNNKNKLASLVATGICSDTITKANGLIDVPACYWKMICYMRNGAPYVVGFLSENKKGLDSPAKLKNETKYRIFTPVSQADIIARAKLTLSPFASPAVATAMKGRIPTGVQLATCPTLLSLDQTEADAWFNDFIKQKKKKGKRSVDYFRHRRDDDADARGCTPAEADAMALLLGLHSLDPDDDENDIPTQNDDDNDLGDVDDDAGTDGRPAALDCGKRIVGYYPSWGTGRLSGKHIRRLTHVIFAFFEVDNTGEVFIGSADRTHSQDVQKDTDIAKKRLENLLALKKIYSEQKYSFAVGGWENSQYFSSIAQSPEKRLRFIASSLRLLDEYDLDGIDIDWEHPVTGGAVEGIAQDKQNYVLFMKELRQALDQHGGKKYDLSFASAAGQWTLDPGYDLPELLKYADYVNIMTYDFFGAWDSKWGAYTGPPAPLYFGMPPRFSGKTNVDWTVKYYMCRTNQPHKINMGVPFYGRYWKNVPSESIDPADGMWRKANAVNGKFEGGYAPWNEIKASWLTNPAYQQREHEKSKSSYAYNEQEGIFLGFESPKSLRDKAQYAADKNVGGLMVWAIDQDDDDLTMLNIVSSAPLCQKTDPAAIFYKCSPLKGEKRWWTLEDSEEKAGMCGRSAPLYKGYYPLCDPDDPGYSCCSPQGYCGFSDTHCKPPGVNYGENPDLLIEEPIRPTITPILWYLLDAPDGRRGRCGRDAPKLDNGEYAICNPDDKNAYCCSNGGYCGVGAEFCDCEECINFKTQPNYRFKPKTWSDDGRCGANAPRINNQVAICNPDSKTAYCCSASGYCGSGPEFCTCQGCVNYKT